MKASRFFQLPAALGVAAALSLGVQVDAQLLSLNSPVPNGASVNVTGTGATASATLELFANGSSVGFTQADGSGDFTFSSVTIPDDAEVYVQNQESWYFDSAEGWGDQSGGTGGSFSVSGGIGTYTIIDNSSNPSIISTSLGRTSGGAVGGAGHSSNTYRVLEFRLRNTGSMDTILVSTNNGSTAPPASGFTVSVDASNSNYKTYQVPLVDNASGGLNSGSGSNFWLYFQFLNSTNTDVIEFDYIRVREYFDYHFDNDGDLFSFFPTGGTAVVSGGVCTMTNSGAGTSVFLNAPFMGFDASYYSVLETAVDSNPSINPNLQYFNYFSNGLVSYAAGSHQINWTPSSGSFVTVIKDLTDTPSFGQSWTGLSTLNAAGGFYSPIFPNTANESADVDYIRLRPAAYYGPSTVATALPVELDMFMVE